MTTNVHVKVVSTGTVHIARRNDSGTTVLVCTRRRPKSAAVDTDEAITCRTCQKSSVAHAEWVMSNPYQ